MGLGMPFSRQKKLLKSPSLVHCVYRLPFMSSTSRLHTGAAVIIITAAGELSFWHENAHFLKKLHTHFVENILESRTISSFQRWDSDPK